MIKSSFSLIAIVAAMLAATSCSQQDKVVEYPLIDMANTDALDFAKIELTDTATILHTNAYFRPHNWIRISSESYLLADGEKYMLTGSNGIEADSLFFMPDSGEAQFTLFFEPVPRNTRQFDFIEGESDDSWKILGIDLTGKKSYDPPTGLPSELLNPIKSEAIPDPVFKSGETTLNIHYMGYRKEIRTESNVSIANIFGLDQTYTVSTDTLTGTGTLKFMQHGPAQAIFGVGRKLQFVWLAPGETADVYVDMRQSGELIVARRSKKGLDKEIPALKGAYAAGTYGDLSNAYATPDADYSMPSKVFDNYEMSADEYTDTLIATYKSITDSIEKSDMPQLTKELQSTALKQETLYLITFADNMRENGYRLAHDMWDPTKEVNGIDKITAKHLARVAKLFDINDPKLLMGKNMVYYIAALNSPDFDWADIANITVGIVPNLRKSLKLAPKAAEGKLKESEIKSLGLQGFYADALMQIQAQTEASLAALKGKAKVETAPAVPNAKLFDAIIAPYRGKVILVDFWNTWCRPCRNAIAKNEPLKDTELKNDDLVWIYIANESSPLITYQTMIADIKGIHYRLNNEQWNYITAGGNFRLDGIPSYVLVDKSGNYSLRNDFRNHDVMKSALKEELSK